MLISYLQRLKIISDLHADRPKFHFFLELFTIFQDFSMNIMGIKTRLYSLFSEKMYLCK